MVTGEDPESSLAALLCALSFASGLTLGDRMEHGIGSAYVGSRLADALGLGDEEREAIYYGALLKDAGCTACASLFDVLFENDPEQRAAEVRLIDRSRLNEVLRWLAKGVPDDDNLPARAAKLLSLVVRCGPVLKEAATSHCEVAELFARRLGFGSHVQQAVRFQWERWDGRGPAYGLKGNASPVAARVLYLAQVAELCHSVGGRSLAKQRVREARGQRFDPAVARAFLSLAEREEFWRELEQDALHAQVLAIRPTTAAELRTETRVDAVCEALADFVDMRSRSRWHHSRAVAEPTVAIARQLGLGPAEQQRARRAALVHDLGIVTVPLALLDKPEPLAESEREQLRLHSHYTERVLERVEPLRGLALEASADHEWVNGQGYHHHLAGEQIPLVGRILAVADMAVSLASAQKDSLESADCLPLLQPLVGTQLDAACYEALASARTGRPVDRTASGRAGPSRELTEREIEVLQLLARGLSNPQIGQQLVISKKTVEHHLEHIYGKLGISTRTSAVAYAVHQGFA